MSLGRCPHCHTLGDFKRTPRCVGCEKPLPGAEQGKFQDAQLAPSAPPAVEKEALRDVQASTYVLTVLGVMFLTFFGLGLLIIVIVLAVAFLGQFADLILKPADFLFPIGGTERSSTLAIIVGVLLGSLLFIGLVIYVVITCKMG